jgi:hypothetical protein
VFFWFFWFFKFFNFFMKIYKKTLKNPKKNPKTQKTQTTPKTQITQKKKPTGLFFFINPGFFQPWKQGEDQQQQHRSRLTGRHHQLMGLGRLSSDGGSHNPPCLLRGSSSGSQPQLWSAYGNNGGGGNASAGGAGLMMGDSNAVVGEGGGGTSSKHGGHEGHFGYNQSNMMQRGGAPASMSGYSSLPGTVEPIFRKFIQIRSLQNPIRLKGSLTRDFHLQVFS